MTAIIKVFSWLNQFDRSHLSKITLNALGPIRNQSTPTELLSSHVETIIRLTESALDPLEHPEVLLECAMALYQKEQFKDADSLMRKVIPYYIDDSHRQAIAVWLWGAIQIGMFEFLDASTKWKTTLKNLSDLTSEKKELSKTHKSLIAEVLWYVTIISELESDLYSLPEEVFDWLNQFEPGYLSDANIDFQQILNDDIRYKRFPHAWETIKTMITLSEGSMQIYEKPEVLVSASIAIYEMGNPEAAKQYLDQAYNLYSPHSHRQAVVKWLIGIMEWQIYSSRNLALRSWREATDIFQVLGIEADQANLQNRKNWYWKHIQIMEAMIKQKLQTRFSS